jgi:hypothetical protein
MDIKIKFYPLDQNKFLLLKKNQQTNKHKVVALGPFQPRATNRDCHRASKPFFNFQNNFF